MYTNKNDSTTSRELCYTADSRSSCRKLLSSHHSIYNALTDPLLDCTSAPLSRTTSAEKDAADNPHPIEKLEMPLPCFRDPFSSFSSWSPVDLGVARQVRITSPFTRSSSRPTSASILSNSTDEDNASDSFVLVPALKKQNPSDVLLFETDEEDDAEDDAALVPSIPAFKSADTGSNTVVASSNSHKGSSMDSNSSQSFIMPKLSVSSDIDSSHLLVVSSTNNLVCSEINVLINYLNSESGSKFGHIITSHLKFSQSPSQSEVLMARNADLLIVVNDGTPCVSTLLSQMTDVQSQKQNLPKIMVLNIMKSNYFSTLFQIINCIRPEQTLKCPSLTNAKVLNSVEEFIASNVGQKSYRLSSSPPVSVDATNASQSWESETTEECANIQKSDRKLKYKYLERTIREEMWASQNYDNVDPLNISTNLGHFNAVIRILSRRFSPNASGFRESVQIFLCNDKVLFVCSFAIGIGVGLALNAFQFFEVLKPVILKEPAKQPKHLVKVASDEEAMKAFASKVNYAVEYTTARIHESFTTILDKSASLISRISGESSLNKLLVHLRQVGSNLTESSIRGWTKANSLFFSCTE